jgi:predicted PurR-regulated permease PerM
MSPLVIFASLTVWAWLLGPTGAILAIPLTMMVKQVLLEGFDSTRPLAVLLSMKDEGEQADMAAPLEPGTVEQGIP